jgi:hypothetical protein
MSRASRNPEDGFWERLDELERRVGAIERANPRAIVVHGIRTDLASGRGPRVRVLELSDGTYGIERWTAAGVRQVATFS